MKRNSYEDFSRAGDEFISACSMESESSSSCIGKDLVSQANQIHPLNKAFCVLLIFLLANCRDPSTGL